MGPGKAVRNLAKHGVPFPEAVTVLDDPSARTIADPDHSRDEVRSLTPGRSTEGRLIVISHTDREGRTRIISPRPASRKERNTYEGE